MVSPDIAPENYEERLIWYAITGTYVFYVLGALYIVAPALAWLLCFRLLRHYVWPWYVGRTPLQVHIPLAVWVWIAGMLVMLLALVIGHINFELGMGKLLKSAVGWAKGWALFALFPLIGCLPIRPQLIYRASTIVAYHTLMLLPVFIAAYVLHLPMTLYVSPLQVVGGAGLEFFAFTLYEIEPSGGVRWRFFTPWAPAAGFVGNIYFLFALQESQPKWRWLGIAGSIAMILLSKSRLALVVLSLVWLSTRVCSALTRPATYFVTATSATLAGFFGVPIVDFLDRLQDAFRSARADSTRVRDALGRIAFERWSTEAPVWGHGIPEPGPHLVEYMLIGSHHSWYGLLFIKGMVGLLALAIPLLWSFCTLLIRAQSSPLAALGLSFVLTLTWYTFGENLEILAYLFWPALVVMGTAFGGETRPLHT